MQIKFHTEYEYNPERGRYECRLSLSLPKYKDCSDILKEFQANRSLMGEFLQSYWGCCTSNLFRERSEVLFSESIEDLKEAVKLEIAILTVEIRGILELNKTRKETCQNLNSTIIVEL